MTNASVPIADDLRRQIASGELREGQKLPAESKLAASYGVSTPTLRNALRLLEADGLLEKHHGKGNYVRRRYNRITYLRGQIARPAVERALQVHIRARDVKANAPLAELLEVDTGADLAEFAYVSFLHASPQVLARVYVPHAVARLDIPTGDLSPWGDDVEAMLAEAGVHVASTVDRLVTRLPRPDEAVLLHIARTVPVTAIERLLTDGNERIVAASLLTLRGDSTEAVFIDKAPAAVPTDSPLRRLPWDTPHGKPCFLSSADAADGVVARTADAVEAHQMNAAVVVLSGARAVLEASSSHRAISFALKRALESLEEVLRIAEGRGAPMPPTDEADPGTEAGRLNSEETARAPE
ncbi:GntR family transcriptional regulator [Streptomyces sp. UNOB3_S3]|uniref:GntR family transcriptional regulator n=1 Tax=Streptomyces sp. UNOB3_S3 TaxID=2871682 RepID=UPI001E3947FC|nr:GntR family transcriptional regulator [Streptomyces sp. UNOB3_S3]MCC3774085.1 GntR family transcriptional regulator [Streptomyces sp. UNOB3_S3]